MTENTLSPAAGIGVTVAVIALMAIAVFTLRHDAKTRAADAAFSQALSAQIDATNARTNARREAWIQIIKQARKQARNRNPTPPTTPSIYERDLEQLERTTR